MTEHHFWWMTIFGFDIVYEDYARFILIHSDTNKPDQLVAYIKEVFASLQDIVIEEASIQRYMKVIHGGYLRGLNFVEYIANTYAQYHLHNMDMFEVLEFIEEVTVENVMQARESISLEYLSSFVIESKE